MWFIHGRNVTQIFSGHQIKQGPLGKYFQDIAKMLFLKYIQKKSGSVFEIGLESPNPLGGLGQVNGSYAVGIPEMKNGRSNAEPTFVRNHLAFQDIPSWNQIDIWLRELAELQMAGMVKVSRESKLEIKCIL